MKSSSFVREVIENAPSAVEVTIPVEMRGERVEVLVLPVNGGSGRSNDKAGASATGEGSEHARGETDRVQALRELEEKNGWPPGFLDELFGSLIGAPTLDDTDTEPLEWSEE